MYTRKENKTETLFSLYYKINKNKYFMSWRFKTATFS